VRTTFNIDVPDFGGARALRTDSANEILDGLKALKDLDDDDVRAEVIALAFVHPENGVRKKATALMKKHVAEAAGIKAVYKTLSNTYGGTVDDRLLELDHPLTSKIACAMVFHGRKGLGAAFVKDDAARAWVLERVADQAKREKSDTLELDELYWNWNGSSGSVASMHFGELPESLGAELVALHKERAFSGLRLHGAGLRDLPESFEKLAPFLKTLQISCNDFGELPAVVLELKNLESLVMWGTDIEDLPELTRLEKLTFIDIGNSTKMTTVPDAVCAHRGIKRLRVGNGRIRKIPDAISQMESLEVLEMASTQIGKLPRTMSQLPNLEKVVIRWSRISEEKAREAVGAGVKLET
jgi:hypothetical protein